MILSFLNVFRMKKLLVLGSMVSALVLMGAGCATGNTVVENMEKPQQEEGKMMPAEEASPQAALPESEPNASMESSKAPASAPKPAASAPAPVTTQPETREITIASFAFSPASVTVKAGTTVKWTNNDPPHSIVSSDGKFTGSSVLSNGGSYQFKFDKPGTYNYICGLHPSMSGQIIVQ